MAVIEVYTLVQNFREKLLLSLREEGVKESKLLGFDTASASTYGTQIFVGFGVKDGYTETPRKGSELFDKQLASALKNEVYSISAKHRYDNEALVNAVAKEHGKHGIVVTSVPGILLKPTAFVSLTEKENLPALLNDENLFKYTKGLYKKLVESIDLTLEKFGKNPEHYKEVFKSKQETEANVEQQKLIIQNRHEIIVDSVMNIFRNSAPLKTFLDSVEASYDLKRFSLTERYIDNEAKVTFNPKHEDVKVDLKSEKKIAEQMIATVYHYLGDNKHHLPDGSKADELQNKLAYQYNNTMLHNNRANLMLFQDPKTLLINKDLLAVIEQIEAKLEKPGVEMQQILKTINAAYNKDIGKGSKE
jgi:hypothetical protein